MMPLGPLFHRALASQERVMFERLKHRRQIAPIKSFMRHIQDWNHCSHCGDIMTMGVIPNPRHYSTLDGSILQFVIVWACHQYRSDGDPNSNEKRGHNWTHRVINYNDSTVQWLRQNQDLAGAKRALNVYQDEGES
jgi:hypothetical protein